MTPPDFQVTGLTCYVLVKKLFVLFPPPYAITNLQRNAFCTFQSLTPYLTMKECVTLLSCWVCWTKVPYYSILTSEREGQREDPRWSSPTILLIFCTVSHLLLLKNRKKNCSHLSVTVAFVFAF